MKLFCNNKKCRDSGLKYTNGLSNKMLQSAIINTNGKNKITYNNSKTNTINAIILSGDYNSNRKLLLSLCYRVYIQYFEPLSILYPNIVNMLNQIILDLSDTEYKNVFQAWGVPPVTEPLKTAEIIKKTYYVVSNNIKENVSYFIFKNMTMYDTFLPTFSYRFDVSDPSNKFNELSFSPEKDYIPYKHIERIGDPGIDVSACVIITFPFDISYTKLYIYNSALEKNSINRIHSYTIGGYTLEYIPIYNDAVSIKSISKCKNNNNIPYTEIPLFVQPYIPKKYDIPYIETNPTVCLTQSSLLSINPYNGLSIIIYDISNINKSLFYTLNFYGVSLGGVYYINVPKIYQLAFLNKNQTDNFVYTPLDPTKSTTAEVIGTDNDGTYNFYYGTIKLEVKGSFQAISIYTLRYGYLGGYKKIVYTDKCADILTTFSNKPNIIRF
jgi:hypothetical protein